MLIVDISLSLNASSSFISLISSCAFLHASSDTIFSPSNRAQTFSFSQIFSLSSELSLNEKWYISGFNDVFYLFNSRHSFSNCPNLDDKSSRATKSLIELFSSSFSSIISSRKALKLYWIWIKICKINYSDRNFQRTILVLIQDTTIWDRDWDLRE